MINRATLSPCPAMARGWRLGRLLTTATALDSGHVRVYEYSGSAWAQLGTDIDGEAADDQSGFSVSLSSDGTRVAIGASETTATVTTQATCGSMTTMAVLGLKLGADIDGEAADDHRAPRSPCPAMARGWRLGRS